MIDSRQPAFTLAEVLIALALLGVVSAFAIPKILENTQNAKRTAVFKETIALLNQVTYEGVVTGDIYNETSIPYFKRRLNALKTCPSNYVTEECHTYLPPDNIAGAGFILPNGAALFDVEGSSASCRNQPCNDGIYIDWNGTKPPNAEGDDIIVLLINTGKGTYTGNTDPGRTLPGGIKSGSVGPYCSNGGLLLYNQIYGTRYALTDCLQ